MNYLAYKPTNILSILDFPYQIIFFTLFFVPLFFQGTKVFIFAKTLLQILGLVLLSLSSPLDSQLNPSKSLGVRRHYFPTSPHLLKVNSLKI
jgi:hypothetical protein